MQQVVKKSLSIFFIADTVDTEEEIESVSYQNIETILVTMAEKGAFG